MSGTDTSADPNARSEARSAYGKALASIVLGLMFLPVAFVVAATSAAWIMDLRANLAQAMGKVLPFTIAQILATEIAFGLVAVPILGLGLILGILAIRQLRRNGLEHGRLLASSGVALNATLLAVVIVFAAIALLPDSAPAVQRGQPGTTPTIRPFPTTSATQPDEQP